MKKLWTLFIVFLSISSVALGGGLTMLPLMSKEFTEKRNWLSDNDMLDIVAVMQSLPGIISVNMAILIGYRIAGVPGAVSSVLGVVLTPFVVILAIAMGLAQLDESETLNHLFLGVRSAVAALILLSAIKLGRQIIKTPFAAIVACAGFIATVFFNLNAIFLVIAGAVLGLLAAYAPLVWRKRK